MNITLTPKEVKDRVRGALVMFFLKERYLLEKDVNERSISHRLAIYLEMVFEWWIVDCEYNRDIDDPKIISNVREIIKATEKRLPIEDVETTTAYPDIIVHRRGTNDHNLIAIEIKKSTSKVEDRIDLSKLSEYKEKLGYAYGLFLKLPIVDAKIEKVRWEWVQTELQI